MAFEKLNRILVPMFLGFLFIAVSVVLLVATSNIANFNQWCSSSTKVEHMRSMFALGAATSIAFAVAGPQLQHALGPKINLTIEYVSKKARNSNTTKTSLERMIDLLNQLNRSQKIYFDDLRGNLYSLHFFVTLGNVLLLLWSSLIRPDGAILNIYALMIIFASIIFPIFDLNDVYRKARQTQPILQKSKSACDSGMPKLVETVCKSIGGEIKSYSVSI